MRSVKGQTCFHLLDDILRSDSNLQCHQQAKLQCIRATSFSGSEPLSPYARQISTNGFDLLAISWQRQDRMQIQSILVSHCRPPPNKRSAPLPLAGKPRAVACPWLRLRWRQSTCEQSKDVFSSDSLTNHLRMAST